MYEVFTKCTKFDDGILIDTYKIPHSFIKRKTIWREGLQ